MKVQSIILLSTPLLALGNYNDGAEAGDYEEYVFAMEWETQWLMDYCKSGIAAHMDDSYASTHLSIHGLWPNYNSTLHDGYSWPQFCVRDGQDYTECESDLNSEDFCTPSAALEAYNTTDVWQKFALEYVWSDLSSHEWAKHGSCSPWDDVYYFQVINDKYNEMINGAGSQYLTAHVGESVTFDDLYAEFAKDTNNKTLALVCESCVFSQVWTAWEADPDTYLPSYAIDINDSSSCQSCSSISIPSWDSSICA